MNKNILPFITYTVKTRLCKNSNKIKETIFNDENSLEARKKAFKFIENYLEVIANDGLVKVDSNTINKKAINKINFDISQPNDNNYNRLKLFNQENIVTVPNDFNFPFGITLSFKLNNSSVDYPSDIEYEIYSLKEIKSTNYKQQLNNLSIEYIILNKLNYNLKDYKVEIKKEFYNVLNLENNISFIIDTPFKWVHLSRQIFIAKIFDKNFHVNNLNEHLINHKKYNYVAFLEENCSQEIEENIYSMLHGKGGILFIGYHPDNFIESVLSNEEINDYYDLLHYSFSKDKYLYKNVDLDIINYEGFNILCIIVHPLNEESKQSNAYNPDKIFIRQNNKIIKIIK